MMKHANQKVFARLALTGALLATLLPMPGVRAAEETKSVQLNPTAATFVSERQEEVSFNTQSVLKVAYETSAAGTSGATASLLKFDLKSIPEDATITSAVLKLEAVSAVLDGDIELILSQAPTEWAPDITWKGLDFLRLNFPQLSVRTLRSQDSSTLTTDGVTLEFPENAIADSIEKWRTNPDSNNGFILYSNATDNPYELIFHDETTDRKPVLNVTYSQPDKTAPVITEITVSNDAPDEVTIRWKTDEEADSYVSYGLTDSYGTTFGQDGKTKNHSVVLKNLDENATYHYEVKSKDADGNLATQKADPATFETKDPAASGDGDDATADPEPEASTTDAEAVAATTAAEDPASAPPKDTTAAGTTTNKKGQKPGGELTLSEGDSAGTQTTALDRAKDTLAKVLPVIGVLVVLVVVFRMTIGNYLGTPVDHDTPAPPEPVTFSEPYQPTPGMAASFTSTGPPQPPVAPPHLRAAPPPAPPVVRTATANRAPVAVAPHQPQRPPQPPPRPMQKPTPPGGAPVLDLSKKQNG